MLQNFKKEKTSKNKYDEEIHDKNRKKTGKSKKIDMTVKTTNIRRERKKENTFDFQILKETDKNGINVVMIEK